LGLPVRSVVTGLCLHCQRRYRRKEPVFADWNASIVRSGRIPYEPIARINDW
jgi:hypothetical protein